MIDASNYDQSVFLKDHNATQLRARSNSYNSPAQQSELGPLAHIPSPDPDHIDGLHRHNSHSERCSTEGNGPAIPALPPLSFDSSASRISMSFISGSKEVKDLKELPDPPSGLPNLTASSDGNNNRASAIFQNPSFNSSAPVLSTGVSAPPMPHRAATSPQKKLSFATSLAVYDTFSPSMYDRRSEPATWSRLTPALAQRIKEELNSYKMEEMEVHAASRIQYVSSATPSLPLTNNPTLLVLNSSFKHSLTTLFFGFAVHDHAKIASCLTVCLPASDLTFSQNIQPS